MTALGGLWAHYQHVSAFVLGFHGCDKSVGEAVLNGRKSHLSMSQNDYDWLGHGIYFWENSPQRAIEFACEAAQTPHLTRGTIKKPFILGAVIDLGLCLNMTDAMALQEVADAYDLLTFSFEDERVMPENKLGRRFRDCAVIETLHAYRAHNNLQPYDSVRGMFVEGTPLYPGAGFNRNDHVQLCVRNASCIKGYFRPIQNGAQ